jgi:alkyldihydroxyacetonephosphate synthase
MRRWNGWGDDAINYPVPGSAAGFLERQIGKSQPPVDITLDQVLTMVPKAKKINHPLVTGDPYTRLLHSRGQSFPDWVELHSGKIPSFPDGVAYPISNEDVVSLVQHANKAGIRVIPYGGGTSVVGHINPINGKAPVLTIDMCRMNRLINLDTDSLQATFGTGVTGPDLEAQLRAHGFTFGHFPQSFEYSTLGGWIATRSSGQQSLRYGRIEKLFAGGIVVTPEGELVLPSFPASAAGPDLREVFLGSEGRMGVITQANIRICPLPECEEFHTVFFPDFTHGIEAIKEILSSGLSLCMLRLSTANETTTTLALAGHENLIGAMEKLLAIRGLGNNKCMLLLGFSGKSHLIRFYRNEALHITSKFSGTHIGKTFGEQWHKNRFRTPYLRNALWEMGYGVDTLETATDWGNTPEMINRIEAALRDSISHTSEKVHIFSHLSHVYPYGSSIYTTYIFKLSSDPDESIERWKKMKSAASQVIISTGGTISHQHGVGQDHLSYLLSEKGPLGLSAITALCRQFDPKGIMNPGKLVA